MSSHSRIGASGAKRWMACPASIALSEGLPDSPTSKYAEEGTQAHELAEAMLWAYVKGTAFVGSASDEMVGYVTEYVDFILGVAKDVAAQNGGDCKILIEEKVHISWVHEGLWGTADCIIYDEKNDHMHVFDLKYGQGIMVDAEENPQLLFYATGAFLKSMPETITSYIIQPRANMGDTVKSWTYPADRIHQFEKELKEALTLVAYYKERGDAEKDILSGSVHPGDHCQFCPAKAKCPKHLETFTDLTTASSTLPAEVGDELVLKVITQKKALLDWIKEIEKQAEERLLQGEKIEGLKLIKGTKHRVWKDEGIVLRKYGVRKITNAKIMTPAQAEKVFGREELSRYITTPEGQPKLALESAKGKAIAPPALETFKDTTTT